MSYRHGSNDDDSVCNIKRNKFSTAYGLVVCTKYPTLRVTIVERNVPYCLHNQLIGKIKSVSFNSLKDISSNLKTNDGDDGCCTSTLSTKESILHWIRKFIETYTIDFDHTEKSDIKDYLQYKSGRIFEDKYDFPHGQMTRRTKRYLNRQILGLKKLHDKDKICYIQLLKKIAGFITAFKEFEEETGYTFRFDSDMVTNDVKEIHLSFDGLDGYRYEQHYFIVLVDKVEKLKSKRNGAGGGGSSVVANQIDRQVYSSRLMDVEEAKKLFRDQERDVGKYDSKHILLSCASRAFKNMNFFSFDDGNVYDFGDSGENYVKEQMFLDFVKHVEPNIYSRCTRRMRWRDH